MKANFGFGDILVHLLIWLVIIVITFGIGAFFFPYSFAKFVVNHSQVQVPTNAGDQIARYQLKCDLDVFSQIGHIILWIIITLLTLGLGYLFYIYGVWRIVLRNTHLRPIDSPVPVNQQLT